MERINRFIRDLSNHQWRETIELKEWNITLSNYKRPGQYENAGELAADMDLSSFPGAQGTTFFFRKKVELPVTWEAGTIGLVFASSGEGLLRVNGRSYHGLDRNHTFVALDPKQLGRSLELEIELFDPIPEPMDSLNHQATIQPRITSVDTRLVFVNTEVQSLLYTLTVVRDATKLLDSKDLRKTRLAQALHTTMDRFYTDPKRVDVDNEWTQALEQDLVEAVELQGGNAQGLEHMVGQSHIDVAWLWPVRETVRKTSRTFSTVDALMNEYPDFHYAQSQPQLYAFVKENDPELYGRIKARIAEGRWELVGGMWVEPDLNIPGGESLMRQMLYGQRFYLEEFGLTSEIEWLPDTFGYCASLPQILQHGGIRYFMTSKLNWNDTNLFPYDLFHWVGIDGTPVLSYLNHGLNEHTNPKDIHEHWESYRQKASHSEQMLLYGHGDGGGGVTREMLEYIDRSDLMTGQPASRHSTAGEFFKGIDVQQAKLPSWHGDLYLELHRGTYTTHARNKRNNRKAEILYREAELWSGVGRKVISPKQDAEINTLLHDGWKLILLNQFHDIIPGTAITEAYETSSTEYTQVFEKGQSGLTQGLGALSSQVSTAGSPVIGATPYVVYNSLGWMRSGVVTIEGGAELAGAVAYDHKGELLPYDVVAHESAACVQDKATVDEDIVAKSSLQDKSYVVSVKLQGIPAFGYTTIWLKSATAVDQANLMTMGRAEVGKALLGDRWETAHYLVIFNTRGEIISLIDKASDREVIKAGEAGNRLDFFHDRPIHWDAWDVDTRYDQQLAGEAELLSKCVWQQGETQDILRFHWRLNDSEISQDLIFYHHDRRIDFKTHVEWHESHKLLKVGFSLDVLADKATYEIPFGALERPTHQNTSWEQAQFEVCGHRFADLSENGYGVSLLNDCKYGYDIKGSTIRLSLLRSSMWPDKTADQGAHDFTYSLYPHKGDWRQAHTVRRASELNQELIAVQIEEGTEETGLYKQGTLPEQHGFIPFNSQHVVLETVKLAEDGEGIILRLYESAGGRESVSLGWSEQPLAHVYLSNALELQQEEIPVVDGIIHLTFRPYEIKTIKLTF
ncbi:MAG: alpha-mannosidase [Gorillibacterium sp.]|nr:alpha-mannosidase [Gorillibacterium sp.]